MAAFCEVDVYGVLFVCLFFFFLVDSASVILLNFTGLIFGSVSFIFLLIDASFFALTPAY